MAAQIGFSEPLKRKKKDLKFRGDERQGPRGTGGKRGEYDPKHYEVLKEIIKTYF